MPISMKRKRYCELYGPTTGDKVRLGDTELWIEVEDDLLLHGDEMTFGPGKTLRTSAGINGDISGAHGALDLVITNAVIFDPILGIIKADIGIKDGLIKSLGKSGDPSIMDGVNPNMIVGPGTDVRTAEGLIATAGGIDSHVHFIDPEICDNAFSSGITTMIGGGLGATTVPIACSGKNNIQRMLQASEEYPINFGFICNGSASSVEPLLEQICAGAIGLKIHEDWGAMPQIIDTALRSVEGYDVQVQIHTDTLNESGYLDRTLAAIAGRTIHAYHVEGAGGGHAPDILKICGEKNILPSSTNPTNPYTLNTFDEHFDMTMTSHNLNPRIPEDIALAESRIRKETIAAEDVLHDIGAISAIGSDSQGMGRISETISRTWQVASHMRKERGALVEDKNKGNDNYRCKRYLAKYTINPAKITGIDSYVGSLEPGKLADIVLWKPEFFGVKPEVIIKKGFPAYAVMGDANASLMRCAPLSYKRQWGWLGHAKNMLGVNFASKKALDANCIEREKLNKEYLAVSNTRNIDKSDMLYNDSLPNIVVDPETYSVEVDGEKCTCEPMQTVPLGRLYTFR